MKPKISIKIITKYLANEANEGEIRCVQNWINKNEKNKSDFEKISEIWNKSPNLNDFDFIDVNADWELVKARINFNPQEASIIPLSEPEDKFSNYFLLKIAAIVIICIGLSFGIYKLSTLWLNKNNLTVVATGSGQKKKIKLSDGSIVFLNANSKFTISNKNYKKKREVNLDGEAYFEVMPNPDNPFLINVQKASVQVLGTSFNIKSSKDSVDIIVTIVSGKIALFETANKNNRVELIQGQQGFFNNVNGKIVKTENEDLNFLAWKTGKLTFKNTPLADVVSTLQLHYNKELIIENNSLKNYELTSVFNNQKLEQVLEEISLLLNVEYEIKDNTTIIIR